MNFELLAIITSSFLVGVVFTLSYQQFGFIGITIPFGCILAIKMILTFEYPNKKKVGGAK